MESKSLKNTNSVRQTKASTENLAYSIRKIQFENGGYGNLKQPIGLRASAHSSLFVPHTPLFTLNLKRLHLSNWNIIINALQLQCDLMYQAHNIMGEQ
uniref:Uncharacterized protein n=1 Tax=Anguilla anguilla TaxID=7936 RepID=A0A0E9WVG3_ANGAN